LKQQLFDSMKKQILDELEERLKLKRKNNINNK
jgi:hypothetical protein